MSRRTSLTVPIIEHNREHRRSRSAHDRTNASTRTPVIPAPRPSSVPGAYPLSSDEDEEDHDKIISPQTPLIAKARNDAARPKSGSVRISRSKLPTAPEGKPPQLQCSASDPGHLTRDKPEVPDRNSTQISAQIIHLSLIKEAKLDLTGGEEEGSIYVLRDPKRKSLLKIGRSKDPEKRNKKHIKNCGTSLECIFASNRVKNVKRAERLTHIDLKHLKRPWNCNRCSQQHREWFEVEEEIAMKIVKKWTRWINEQEPYLDGQLKPLWGYLMDWGRVPDPELEHQDHTGRWNHWNRVLSPISTVDKTSFQAHMAGMFKQNNGRDTQRNRQANSKNQELSTTSHGPESGGPVHHVASNSHVQFQHAHFYGPAYINQTP